MGRDKDEEKLEVFLNFLALCTVLYANENESIRFFT